MPTVAAEKMKTSELLRESASWLRILTRGGGTARDVVDRIDALAFELGVRSRWIESARADEGVSRDRRQALAMVDEPIGDDSAKGGA